MNKFFYIFLPSFLFAMIFAGSDNAQAEADPECAPVVIPCPEGSPPGLICLGPCEMTVRIPRPNAFYVINRDRMVYDAEQSRQNFTEDLIESVDRDPF